MTARGIFPGKTNPNYKTGDCVNGKRTRLYTEWQNMKRRCTNKNRKTWHRYGGRGITFCESWKTFAPFKEWALNNGYEDYLTLDRIDGDGNYEPSNCQWIPLKANSLKRCTVKLNPKIADEIRKKLYACYRELAKEYNCSNATIWCIANNKIWKKE